MLGLLPEKLNTENIKRIYFLLDFAFAGAFFFSVANSA